MFLHSPVNAPRARHRIFRTGYEIGLLVLLFIGGVAFQSARNYYELSNWSMRAIDVLTQLQIVDNAFETSLVSYDEFLKSRTPEARSQFDARVKHTANELTVLKEFVRSTPDQFEQAKRIETQFHDSFQEPKLGETASPRFLLGELRTSLREMESRERGLLVQRTHNARSAANTTFIVIGLGSVFALSFLVLGRQVMLRDLKEISNQQEELRRAQEKAEAASRSKSEFLANLSHEIRTPMNAVLGMANLLLRKNPRPDQEEYCETIRQSGHALLRVIQDTLDLSRIEAGKLKLEITEFDPRKLLNTVGDIVRPSLSDSVRLKLETDDSLPNLLKGDVGRIQQILLNLASNSAKFTDEGHISIRVTKAEPDDQPVRIRFEVTDTGVGIPQASINKLFQPFSQVSPESPREKKGTGLGLSICKRLVEAMSGEIHVESAEFSGSRFYFDIPLEHGDGTLPVSLESDQSDNAELCFSGRALIVDDNPANLKVAELTMKSIGLECALATSGTEAVEFAQLEDFDLIFMDCQMPGMDGFEATERIRSLEADRRTPIIALTAHASQEAVDKCFAHQMDDFLTKPIEFDHLLAVVGRFLTPTSTPRSILAQPLQREGTPRPTVLAVDFDVLRRLRKLAPPRGEFDSSNEVIDELLRLFSSSLERSLPKLRTHCEAGDAKKFAEEAHYLKSSSTSVGANAVTAILEQMEKMKPLESLPEDARSLCDQLETECHRATDEIQAWWAKERSVK